MSYDPDSDDDSDDGSTGDDIVSIPNIGDALSDANTSGSVAYNPQTTTAGSAGGVINTAQNPLPAPDAGGGNGNFLGVLQQTMTQGINDAVVSASEFGLGTLTDRLSAAATGQVQPAAAQSPATNASPSSSAGTWILLALGGFVLYELLS